MTVEWAFFALLATSTTQYLTTHGFTGQSGLVVALSVAVAVMYSSAVFKPGTRPGVQALLVLLLWLALVYVAPSYWWCTFSLFFLVQRRFPTRWAIVAVTVMTIMCFRAFAIISDPLGWMTLVGIGVVAVLLFAAYYQIEQDNRRQRQLIEELQQAQQSLLMTEHRAGVLAERDRFSRELHDSVTQELTSVLFLMEAAIHDSTEGSAGRSENLRTATGLVRSSLAETRNIVHQLASPRLDENSLAKALVRLAQEFTGATVELRGSERALSDALNHTLLRIAQTALQNAERHAGATEVGVVLDFDADAVSLIVHDDGVGFDPEATARPSTAGGYGLRAIQHRVRQHAGSFNIESRPGLGTTLTVRIPYDSEVS